MSYRRPQHHKNHRIFSVIQTNGPYIVVFAIHFSRNVFSTEKAKPLRNARSPHRQQSTFPLSRFALRFFSFAFSLSLVHSFDAYIDHVSVDVRKHRAHNTQTTTHLQAGTATHTVAHTRTHTHTLAHAKTKFVCAARALDLFNSLSRCPLHPHRAGVRSVYFTRTHHSSIQQDTFHYCRLEVPWHKIFIQIISSF